MENNRAIKFSVSKKTVITILILAAIAFFWYWRSDFFDIANKAIVTNQELNKADKK